MPAQKNQHFVPRCAQKPFTLNEEGAAINVFNIKRERAILNAPLKRQCARPYLYGADLELENMLVKLEGEYARIVRKLSVNGALDKIDHDWLYLFAVIQSRRTARAIEEMREFSELADDVVFKRHPQRRPKDGRTDNEMMMHSMKCGTRLAEYVTDLKPIVFRNRTNVEFVISDNPLVMTNRFHFQRLRASNFGWSNSGALLAIPLSPQLCIIWYDRGVYSIPNASGTPFVDINKADDVAAVNEWQYLSAQDNVYFAGWNDRAYVHGQVKSVSVKRALAKQRMTVLVRDHAAPGKRYRRGTAEEEASAKESLVMATRAHPEPNAWPSQIRFRSKPKTFSNGSAIGLVRKAEWLRIRRRRA
jgi:Protein of unknown function (DUF4238)